MYRRILIYGAVSGSIIQVCLFDMMLRHHNTSLRPLTLTSRLTYTTSWLDDITFRQHDFSFCLDDITFRQHDLSLRRDDITFRQHRLLLRRDDITFRLHYRTFIRQHVLTPLPSKPPSNRGKTSAELPDDHHAVKGSKITRCSDCSRNRTPEVQWCIIRIWNIE